MDLPYAGPLRQALSDHFLDHPQVLDLVGVTLANVVHRGDEERDVADSELGTPAEHLIEVFGPISMTDPGARKALLPGRLPSVTIAMWRGVIESDQSRRPGAGGHVSGMSPDTFPRRCRPVSAAARVR